MDGVKNCFNEEKLLKFLAADDEFCEENNLDYMVCDNFFDQFLGLEEGKITELLEGSRQEGIELSKKGELREAGYGRQETHEVSKKVRCDTLLWLTPLLK